MRIAIGSDHGGFDLKKSIINYLSGTEHAFVDLGCISNDSVDYPEYAEKVVHYILHNGYDIGILLCGTGQGMAICANKHQKIRAALCTDVNLSEQARSHGNCNILCMGGRTTDNDTALAILETFLNTNFQGGRHKKRIEMFSR